MNKFKIDQRVVISGLKGFSGIRGTIVGKYIAIDQNCFSLLLDVPNEWKVVTVPEKYLEPEKEMSIDEFVDTMEKF
jgi:hypothetical protein